MQPLQDNTELHRQAADLEVVGRVEVAPVVMAHHRSLVMELPLQCRKPVTEHPQHKDIALLPQLLPVSTGHLQRHNMLLHRRHQASMARQAEDFRHQHHSLHMEPQVSHPNNTVPHQLQHRLLAVVNSMELLVSLVQVMVHPLLEVEVVLEVPVVLKAMEHLPSHLQVMEPHLANLHQVTELLQANLLQVMELHQVNRHPVMELLQANRHPVMELHQVNRHPVMELHQVNRHPVTELHPANRHPVTELLQVNLHPVMVHHLQEEDSVVPVVVLVQVVVPNSTVHPRHLRLVHLTGHLLLPAMVLPPVEAALVGLNNMVLQAEVAVVPLHNMALLLVQVHPLVLLNQVMEAHHQDSHHPATDLLNNHLLAMEVRNNKPHLRSNQCHLLVMVHLSSHLPAMVHQDEACPVVAHLEVIVGAEVVHPVDTVEDRLAGVPKEVIVGEVADLQVDIVGAALPEDLKEVIVEVEVDLQVDTVGEAAVRLEDIVGVGLPEDHKEAIVEEEVDLQVDIVGEAAVPLVDIVGAALPEDLKEAIVEVEEVHPVDIAEGRPVVGVHLEVTVELVLPEDLKEAIVEVEVDLQVDTVGEAAVRLEDIVGVGLPEDHKEAIVEEEVDLQVDIVGEAAVPLVDIVGAALPEDLKEAIVEVEEVHPVDIAEGRPEVGVHLEVIVEVEEVPLEGIVGEGLPEDHKEAIAEVEEDLQVDTVGAVLPEDLKEAIVEEVDIVAGDLLEDHREDIVGVGPLEDHKEAIVVEEEDLQVDTAVEVGDRQGVTVEAVVEPLEDIRVKDKASAVIVGILSLLPFCHLRKKLSGYTITKF